MGGESDTPEPINRRARTNGAEIGPGLADDLGISPGHRREERPQRPTRRRCSATQKTVVLFGASFLEDVPMRTKKAGFNFQHGQGKAWINTSAQNPSREVWTTAYRRSDVSSTTSGPVVVAAVFCPVF